MVLDVVIDSKSLTLDITDPFRADIDALVSQIEDFGKTNQKEVSSLDLKGLIPAMIRGVKGCERGCPADAKGIVARGYTGFSLQYVEGGILTAQAALGSSSLQLKMFPDF